MHITGTAYFCGQWEMVSHVHVRGCLVRTCTCMLKCSVLLSALIFAHMSVHEGLNVGFRFLSSVNCFSPFVFPFNFLPASL